MGFRFVLVLIGNAFISLSHAVVGDQRIDLHFRELLEVDLSLVSRTSLDERGVFHVRHNKSKLLRNKTLD